MIRNFNCILETEARLTLRCFAVTPTGTGGKREKVVIIKILKRGGAAQPAAAGAGPGPLEGELLAWPRGLRNSRLVLCSRDQSSPGAREELTHNEACLGLLETWPIVIRCCWQHRHRLGEDTALEKRCR